MKHVVARYDFFEVVLFLKDADAIELKASFSVYLSKSSPGGFTVEDQVSSEEILLNFSGLRTLHFNDVSSLSSDQLVALRDSLRAPAAQPQS